MTGSLRECEMPCTPRQYEFARLNLTNTVMSKRKLKLLVDEKHRGRLGRSAHADDFRPPPQRLYAGGDPQLLPGDRRSPRTTALWTLRMLEHFIREDLKLKAPRTMAVMRPA